MKELKTESLESFAAGAKAAADGAPEGPAPSEAVSAPESESQGNADDGGEKSGGGGDTPPQGSPHGEVMPGMQLGKYKIIRRLGEGGMSAVFEAVHVDIHKAVAIKVLSTALSQQEEAKVRFLREAAAASRLQHPHVVDVSDFGTEAGRSYLVMELMRGEDLSQHIQRVGPMATTALADVMLPICAGVQAAHDMKIVHRDLKPQNIFLCRTSMGGVVPKVLDFGISKVVDAEAAALTHSGMMMGTPYYLSPEQIIQNTADHRSDQYALGVILYECATGRRPHEAETLYGILNSITQGAYPRPRALKAEMTEDFENVILRTLSQDAARRFPTVHALGRAMMAFASERQQMIWQDYYAKTPTIEALDPLPPSVSAPASKSGSTEILSAGNNAAATPGATRMLPEGMGSSSFRAQALTGLNAPADLSDDEVAAAMGRRMPKWAFAVGVAVLVAGGAIWALSSGGGDKAKAEAATAVEEPKPAPAEVALPEPVTTGGAAAPVEAPPPPKPEPVAAVEPDDASERSAATSRGSSRRSSRSEKAEKSERSDKSSGSSRSKTPEAKPTAPAAVTGAPADPAAKKRSVEKSGGVPILE